MCVKVSASSSPLLPSYVFKGMIGDDTDIENNNKNDNDDFFGGGWGGGGKIRNWKLHF